jgi:hypothetical protein
MQGPPRYLVLAYKRGEMLRGQRHNEADFTWAVNTKLCRAHHHYRVSHVTTKGRLNAEIMASRLSSCHSDTSFCRWSTYLILFSSCRFMNKWETTKTTESMDVNLALATVITFLTLEAAGNFLLAIRHKEI